MLYREWKEQKSKELNNFRFYFAFNMKQSEEILERHKSKITDYVKIPGGGIHRDDYQRYGEFWDNHEKELTAYMQDEKFFKEAVIFELENNEYCYTWDLSQTLSSLGINGVMSEDSLRPQWVKDCISVVKKRYMEDS